MMIYLTGASASLSKSAEAPQSDANKSLGGYISSTPVPNAAINGLFDMISLQTIKNRYKETIAIGLINKFPYAVTEVEIKIIGSETDYSEFKVSAVSLGTGDYCMEHIANRYQEPLQGDFINVSFYRAAVDVEIIEPAVAGEEVVFDPFNVTAAVLETGIEGTWNAIEDAFSNNSDYKVKRLTEKKFRIERRDENVVNPSLKCSFISTENSDFKFNGEFGNKLDNSALLSERLAPNEAVGIWLQRDISKIKFPNDNQLIEDYDEKKESETMEEKELIISYNLEELTK